jgi:putative ABC transport system ATP-binding protein
LTAVAIRAQGLTKWFGDAEMRITAVREVSFEARFGELLYIVGPSGSGKTTLLSILSGILRPSAGKVELEGRDIWQMSANELADFRLQKIGFVFQDYHLFPRLSTAENVAIPLILRRRAWDEALTEANSYLDIVGLKDRGQLPPVKLSGGEQQRVAIARAVVSHPDFLIFDEPTASLDGDTGRRIIEFVKKQILTPQRCIVVVTHDARIFEYADHIMHMEDGRLTSVQDTVQERAQS